MKKFNEKPHFTYGQELYSETPIRQRKKIKKIYFREIFAYASLYTMSIFRKKNNCGLRINTSLYLFSKLP